VSLRALSASYAYAINGVPPTAGDSFFIVQLSLRNTGAPSSPISSNPVLFSLETQQSLVLSPSAAQPTGACDPSISVASGGEVTCNVAFELPNGQTAITLVYDDRLGDKASAPVPQPASSCPIPSNPSQACGSCLDQATNGTSGTSGACFYQFHDYGISCNNGACLSTCSGSADFCSCEAGCDTAMCQMLFEQYAACLMSACNAQCN
jgi:hypothetical protein